MKPYVRLTEPMVREGGRLRPASWDEALDRAAEGFRRVRAEKGAGAYLNDRRLRTLRKIRGSPSSSAKRSASTFLWQARQKSNGCDNPA